MYIYIFIFIYILHVVSCRSMPPRVNRGFGLFINKTVGNIAGVASTAMIPPGVRHLGLYKILFNFEAYRVNLIPQGVPAPGMIPLGGARHCGRVAAHRRVNRFIYALVRIIHCARLNPWRRIACFVVSSGVRFLWFCSLHLPCCLRAAHALAAARPAPAG